MLFRSHIELIEGANAPGGLRPAGVAAPAYPHPPDKTYAVVFDHNGQWMHLTSTAAEPAFTAFDPIGRAIVHVVRIEP